MTSTAPLSWKDLPGAPAPGTPLAKLSDIADGEVLLVSLESGQQPFLAILLRSGEKAYAYVNRCAHIGVPLATQAQYLYAKPHQTFSCSVHYARYRWEDGFCISGDCEGESLLKIPVEVQDGNIIVTHD